MLFRIVDGKPETLGRVVRSEGTRLWIDAGAGEVEVGRTAVAGKMVRRHGAGP